MLTVPVGATSGNTTVYPIILDAKFSVKEYGKPCVL